MEIERVVALIFYVEEGLLASVELIRRNCEILRTQFETVSWEISDEIDIFQTVKIGPSQAAIC